MKADLHCHSYYSDGELAPRELARLARESGAEAFALTDHDTMLGTDEAFAAAKEFGIRTVSGVEVSSYYGCNVHVLGYNVDKDSLIFRRFADDMARERKARMMKTLEKFSSVGIEVDYSEIEEFARVNPSRVHIAKVLVKRGYARDLQSAFSTWLKEGASCYVPNDFLTPFDAVDIIRKSGGTAVLAHPMRLKMELGEAEKLVAALKENGLEGMEANYKLLDDNVLKVYRDMADRHGLFITNGGDLHSAERSRFVPREISERTVSVLEL